MRAGRRRSPHPHAGALRAYADRELPPLRAWRCAAHLRRCPACRGALERERDRDHRTAGLLARLGPPVDARERWRRLHAQSSPGRSGALTRALGGRTRARHAAVVLFGTAAAAAAVLLVIDPRGTRDEGTLARVRDLCCWDLDGGGPGDDGVVSLTLPGERVLAVTLYEDANASGGLTGRDPIRYGSVELVAAPHRGGSNGPWPRDAATQARPGAAAVVRDFCCADHDGGGPGDDGVFTLSRNGEVVEQVVLYEDRDGTRSFTSGDLVRWSGGPAPWPAAARGPGGPFGTAGERMP